MELDRGKSLSCRIVIFEITDGFNNQTLKTGNMIRRYISEYSSPLGVITMASDGESLTGLWFDGQKYYAGTIGTACEEREVPVLVKTKRWLDIYFAGKEPGFTPPIALSGTPFRLAVWEILREIPYGKRVTYKEIALQVARRKGIGSMSAQAVGGAVGHNPVSIIVPCHRVVGGDGSLTGYAGGIERKAALLSLEDADINRLFVPLQETAP